VLKSLVLTIAIPPLCFLFAAILGLLLFRRHQRRGFALACVGVAGLTLLSLPAVPEVMIVALERNLPVIPPPDAMPQAIVILGGDVQRIAEAPHAQSGVLTLDRLRAGAALYRRTGLPILVTGGVVQEDRPPVGALMADSLRDDFQVPVTWIETVSADTWENADMSAAILKKDGVRSVYVVSQGWHLRRAMLAFRHAGLIATAAPASTEPPLDLIPSDFVPHASTWQWSYYAMHEWIGCAWYAIR